MFTLHTALLTDKKMSRVSPVSDWRGLSVFSLRLTLQLMHKGNTLLEYIQKTILYSDGFSNELVYPRFGLM